MGSPNRKERQDVDRRWLVLLLLAMACSAFTPLGRRVAGLRALYPDAGIPSEQTTKLNPEWQWRESGILGPGVYRSDRSPDAASQTPVDPHLAIFTHRRLDLNQADAEVLQTIKGVGPKLAGAIVGYRERYGPFNRLEDLLLIPGIGPDKLAKMRPRLTVSRNSD